MPLSFQYDFDEEQIPVIVMPDIDIINLQEEDEEEEQLGVPTRFGVIHSVDLNLLDAGYTFIYNNENNKKRKHSVQRAVWQKRG